MADNPPVPTTPDGEEKRTFLCVVDESEELTQALRFACRRAKRSKGGRVGLLYIIQPAEFQHWMGVGDIVQEERREKAEEILQVVAAVVQKQTETMPEVYIREGDIHDELQKLINDDVGIKVLVLGAATGDKGPGPLVSHIVQKMSGKIRVPIVIVPGNLTDAQIDSIT